MEIILSLLFYCIENLQNTENIIVTYDVIYLFRNIPLKEIVNKEFVKLFASETLPNIPEKVPTKILNFLLKLWFLIQLCLWPDLLG